MNYVAHKVVMVRPLTFRSNEQTLVSNAFQKKGDFQNQILQHAQNEFDQLMSLLVSNGIEVLKFDEVVGADTPDCLFPNNWFATLPGGNVFTFAMEAENRRREYRADILSAVKKDSDIIDLRFLGEASHFLEGTGSMVLDHRNKIAYACISSRTTEVGLDEFRKHSGYEIIKFSATDRTDIPYYHTNVIMALGEKSAVLYADGIADVESRNRIIQKLEVSGKQILFLDADQVESFAGNMLFLENSHREKFWICSERALKSLNSLQKQILTNDAALLSCAINTIENVGGGSVRCMLAEIF